MMDQPQPRNDPAASADRERIYLAQPRGLGRGCGGCIGVTCNTDRQSLVHNCAFFVPSRETGEVIVSFFAAGAYLDYRYWEPKWIQVKLSACELHKPILQRLIELVWETQGRNDGPGINQRMIVEALTAQTAKVPA